MLAVTLSLALFSLLSKNPSRPRLLLSPSVPKVAPLGETCPFSSFFFPPSYRIVRVDSGALDSLPTSSGRSADSLCINTLSVPSTIFFFFSLPSRIPFFFPCYDFSTVAFSAVYLVFPHRPCALLCSFPSGDIGSGCRLAALLPFFFPSSLPSC